MSNPSENPYQAAPISQGRVAAQAHLEKVRAVAKAQRLLNIAILLYLLLIIGSISISAAIPRNANSIAPLVVLFVIVGILGFIVFAVAKLAYAMHGLAHAIFYSLASLIPYLGIILLLILNSRVTKFLTRNGVTVGIMGIMGAKRATIP